MSAEKFCLKWQHFEANLCSAFQELRSDADFLDVTLACGDGQQIEAHKVVLSACSPFFRDLLRKYNHPQPLLFLKGVKFSEIVSILNFMYVGEVNVAQDELTSFLSLAEELKVKGLTKQEALGLGLASGFSPQNVVKLNPAEKKDKSEKLLLKRVRSVVTETFSSQQLAKEDAGEDPVNKHPKLEADMFESAEEDTSSNIIIPQPGAEGAFKDDITEVDVNKGTGFDEIWSKLEKSGKIIRCRICGLNKHQDFFATLVNHIRKDHL